MFRAGYLDFIMERFNTGVSLGFGKDKKMTEDSFIVVNDMGIDKHIKCSMYGVYDGHQGVDCSYFL